MYHAAPTRGQAALLLSLAALAPALAPAARADEPQDAGLTVRLPAVLADDAAARLRDAVEGPLRRYESRRKADGKDAKGFKLLLDFNPDGQADATDDYDACRRLAVYLRDLQKDRGVVARAYVHGAVTRHAVLPLLACGDIVMAADGSARFGKVVAPGKALDDDQRVAYEKANGRVTAVYVRKMFDPDVVVEKAPDLGRGVVAEYTFAQAREFGLCEPGARDSLAEAMRDFGLPRSSRQRLLDRGAAFLVKADKPLDGALVEDVERRIRQAVGDKANVLVLQLECGGGDDQAAFDLADFLAKLNDARPDRPVQTVAYVTDKASDTATIVALACDQIVMQRGAALGGFDRYAQAHPDRIDPMRKNLKELAGKQLYPVALAERFVDRGKCLTLGAEEARNEGFAQAVVKDYDELCSLEGVKPGEVKVVEPDSFLTALAGFLCHPVTSVLLVMLGVVCLVLELKLPGASLPGVLAAVCFVLFFWSHSQLHGQISWLALLLFLLGLVLIGLEVFVVRGTAVPGVAGVVLVMASVGLTAYGHWPTSGEEWAGYGQTLGVFGVGILGGVVLAFVLAKHLRHIPWFNRLILKPPGEAAAEGEAPPAADNQSELATLLGAIGVAATPLRPAGKAQFGEQFVDVVAEGGYVQPGTRVQVVEVEGNRVVVKEV
jgi:membrane-bound ClpP family serine protease